jgi:hypothetical protein
LIAASRAAFRTAGICSAGMWTSTVRSAIERRAGQSGGRLPPECSALAYSGLDQQWNGQWR